MNRVSPRPPAAVRPMLERVTAALGLIVPALLAGCGGGASTAAASSDAAGLEVADAAAKACVHPTAPIKACYARWCDNPLGVGMPCTKGGGECKANEAKAGDGGLGAVFCTASASPDEAFCTLPCVDDGDCGAGARCSGDPDNPKSGKGCILIACSAGEPSADTSSGLDIGGSDAAAGSDATAGSDTAAGSDAAPSGDTASGGAKDTAAARADIGFGK